MRILALFLGLPLLLIFGCAGPTEPLNCEIWCDEPICERGKVPDIAVVLRNQTKSDIHLVGSLDGSDSLFRYPYCYFEVMGPDGKSAVQGIPRCGNVNTLREKDFVKVQPDEGFFPYQSGLFFSASQQLNSRTFGTLGEYHVRFIYDTSCDTIDAWQGKQLATNEKVNEMFKLVPKVEIKSNEIKITIVEPRT